MKGRHVIRIMLGIAAILLVPWIAMQFTNEVRWTSFDFVAAAVLLLAGALTYEFAASRTHQRRYKAIIGIAVAGALFLIWLQLAAGII